MFVKINSGIINTDFICAIANGGLVATKEEPYTIYFANEKTTTITEKQYKRLIELLQPTELGE